MDKVIITINAGSSSLKFAIFALTGDHQNPIEKLLRGEIAQITSQTPQFTMKDLRNETTFEEKLSVLAHQDHYQVATSSMVNIISKKFSGIQVVAVANRVVHGADQFQETTLLNDKILQDLKKYIPLAALHQPYNLKIAAAFYAYHPEAKHFGCFDTAFHQTIDVLERTYAIPSIYTKKGIKKYGFHGLSYQYIVSQLATYVGEEASHGKWILAHLGSGASIAAAHHKKSVATTMGFSVLAGIPMGTRCGDIDPEIAIYLQEQEKLSLSQVQHILYKDSGLLGASGGISNDVRVLQASPQPEAKFALDLFCHKIVLSIGQLVAALEGCDGLVFTAGIGENSLLIRQTICAKLRWLGIEVDHDKNANTKQSGGHINKQGSIPVLVIPTDEEYVMAHEAYLRM